MIDSSLPNDGRKRPYVEDGIDDLMVTFDNMELPYDNSTKRAKMLALILVQDTSSPPALATAFKMQADAPVVFDFSKLSIEEVITKMNFFGKKT
jgi:hypothetical protein